MKTLFLVTLVLWLIYRGRVAGQALRCPKVTTYNAVCSPRTEHFCESDDECSEGRRCCPSRQGACQLTCTKAEVLEGCPKPVDLVLLIDASGSISRRNFVRFKVFLKRLVDEFDISESGTHVALVEYSTEASVQLKFNDYSGAFLNAANVKRRIDKIPHTRGYTYIDKALALANSEVLSTKGGMRQNVSKVAIVMTDGAQTVPGDGLKSSSEILDAAVQPVKDKGVEVMSIGIGKGIDLVDLVTLASDDTGVFLAETFAALNEIATDIRKGKCPGEITFLILG
ncbi:matrilin-3-like [Stylophora pistillata]|uniref:matrilin-3-like n=1 Tax=Stylophora pistillata TaxID=50429 RepID=UPI000C04CC91|nr:matrilin-3-like [Stylophora pistillata]